jgi:hypothetical protein
MQLDVAYLPVRRNHNPVVTGRIEILFRDGQAIAGILVCLLSYFPLFFKVLVQILTRLAVRS